MHLPPQNRIATLNRIITRPRRSPPRAEAIAAQAKRLAARLIHRAWDDDCADLERELLEEAAIVLRAQAEVIGKTKSRR